MAQRLINPCRYWVAIALLALLPACTTAPPPLSDQVQRPPKALENWSVAGKAALTSDAGTDTVNLRWQRDSRAEESLQLTGPVGLGAVALSRRGEVVTWIKDNREEPLATMPLDTSARRAVIELPLDKVGDWLLGYPSTDGDWQVDVTEWQGAGAFKVPRKLYLQHPDFTVKLILLDWSLTEAR